MICSIHNSYLTLSVDTLGAQMMSILSSDGCEYLWQGDAAYWQDRAPVLFPMIGRLYGEKYCIHGKQYSMGIHGFAAGLEFAVAEHSGHRLVLRLTDSPETLKQYPFPFVLEITYVLTGSTVEVTFRVQNTGSQTMSFGIGGHPGFRVPLEEGEHFEDYTLAFSRSCRPDRMLFNEQILVSGQTEPFRLENDCFLPLDHKLFDNDAIILQNTDRQLTLCSKGKRSITLAFPHMPYVGIWHWPKTDAPYVCIEPWSSLPGRQELVEDLSCRSDLIHLTPGNRYCNTWSITIG